MMIDSNGKNALVQRIAFIGDYLPRECGIATFTSDIVEGMATSFPELEVVTLAVNDTEEGYEYESRVRFQFNQEELDNYHSAADFLNLNNFDLVCLQHEYGIYGGPAGSHILTLLRELQMPVVTTLHTVLQKPDENQYQVMKELAMLSDRLVVMSEIGVRFLTDIYGVPADKIDYIPHGIPDVPFVDPNFFKDKFGVEGKRVMLTFGLLSPNKGIETAIRALPAIVEKHPEVVYMVVGATHPHVRRSDGEAYRKSLTDLAKELNVEDHVIFLNRFVALEELIELIGAADIYVTPYLDPSQITSGTLAYALGAGKALLSTPYWYAEELLDEGRGLIFPFNDPAALSERVDYLLTNEGEMHAMRKRAYMYGREMIWPRVAERYMKAFEQARMNRMSQPKTAFWSRSVGERPGELPGIKLDHLLRMTDDTGVLQHAVFDVPNYNEGYTLDDNARALQLAIHLEGVRRDHFANAQALASRYLAFVWHAFNPESGRFRNFMGFDRMWIEPQGSEDSHGRALWSLGDLLGRASWSGLCNAASRLFNLALPASLSMRSPRAWAFTLLGINEYFHRFSGDLVFINAGKELMERLVTLYKANRKRGWHWFEEVVTYSNASLPHALLVSSEWTGSQEARDIGLESLKWLTEMQTSEHGHFVPIGSNGFYQAGGDRALFDQQPIEAGVTVSAALEACRITGDLTWAREAYRAFGWFIGENDLGLPVYDADTGGCRDGLHPDRANQNQGAESTLAFLNALVELRLYEHHPLNSERALARNAILKVRATSSSD